MFDEWTPPAPTEIEVSVFGRGYGESIVVHLGDAQWIVIDSLTSNGAPIPLLYLKTLGVDVARSVVLVMATHWHDDHIRGIAKVCDEARSARISFPMAMLRDEFRSFAQKFTRLPAGKTSSGVDELGNIIDLVTARGWHVLELGKAWTNFLRYAAGSLSHGAPIEVEAMSPSNADANRFLAMVAAETDPDGTARRAPRYDRNDISCALHIRAGTTSIVLGADLEKVSDPHSGWEAVLAAQQLPQRTSMLIKVPHHGSATGDHPGIWSRLCLPKPVASLATWARGDKKLPSRSDIVRITGLTGESYSTSRSSTSGSGHRLQAVNSVLHRTKSKVRRLDTSLGHVRHRMNLASSEPKWVTELIGGACPLNQVA